MRPFTLLACTAGLVAAAPVLAQQTDSNAPPPGMQAGRGMGGMGRGGMGMGGMGGVGALMQADTNHDGIITREEAVASADRMFDRIDANHDGVVTPDEMRAYRDAMRPGGAPDGGSMVPPPPPPPGAAPAGLTREQWRDRALRQFDRIDVNHDGHIDRTEIANYQEMMRMRRMERRDGSMPPPPPGAPTPPAGQQQ